MDAVYTINLRPEWGRTSGLSAWRHNGWEAATLSTLLELESGDLVFRGEEHYDSAGAAYMLFGGGY